MKKLLIFAFIGLMAQLIDGSLGMAYGVTSSSLLLTYGIAPAIASASVHFAEVVTTAASGASHIKFGNVDKQTVFRLIIPGSIGAFLGATFLSNIPGDSVKPYISLFLLTLGFYVLAQFLFNFHVSGQKRNLSLKRKESIPLGLIAGFADATGGGGWGPIATPILLSKKGISPRKVIGTVDTSEFAIAVSATLGFLISLGWEQVNWIWVGALMLGGIIAAPVAAWLVRKLHAQLMGVLVGGFIILINARILVTSWIDNEATYPYIYLSITVVWGASILYAVYKALSNKKLDKPKK